MKFKAEVRWAKNWESMVANATADDTKVKAACVARAKAIAGTARQNVRAAPGPNKGVKRLARRTAQLVGTKSVRVFRRNVVVPRTRIPVALVVSDSDKSAQFEYGTARSFPATHFMAKAVRVHRKGDKFYGVRNK